MDKEKQIERVKYIFDTLIGEEDSLDNFVKFETHYTTDENELFSIESEYDEFGGEGMGDEYRLITKVVDKEFNEQYFIEFYGSYDSWNGVSWEGWNLVEPFEVTVTKYKVIE